MQKAHVTSWEFVVGTDITSPDNPDNPEYTRKILAEGDSWFSIGAIPTSNFLFPMKFNHRTITVNCATPGDTIRNMTDITENQNLKDAMSQGFGYAWDLILFSGGGNDLIDDAAGIVKHVSGNPSDITAYCDDVKLQQTLKDVSDGYKVLIDLRDKAGSSCKDKPIVTHTYDFVAPRNAPARFFGGKLFGPWLYKAFTAKGVPKRRWNDLSDYLIGELGETIKGLATGTNQLPHFYVVNTHNTLIPAELDDPDESNDWMNEIHPSSDGYKKLAGKLSLKARQLLV